MNILDECTENGNIYSPVAGTHCAKFTQRTDILPPVEHDCPAGLQFNIDVCVCDWPWRTTCPNQTALVCVDCVLQMWISSIIRMRSIIVSFIYNNIQVHSLMNCCINFTLGCFLFYASVFCFNNPTCCILHSLMKRFIIMKQSTY